MGAKDIEYKDCVRRFRLRESLYKSTKEVKFPVVMEVGEDDYIKKEMNANVIDFNGIGILCGLESMKNWNTAIQSKDRKLDFNDQGKSVVLDKSKGGHMIVNLERVGEWMDLESIYLVKKESDATTVKAITKIHKNP